MVVEPPKNGYRKEISFSIRLKISLFSRLHYIVEKSHFYKKFYKTTLGGLKNVNKRFNRGGQLFPFLSANS